MNDAIYLSIRIAADSIRRIIASWLGILVSIILILWV